MHSDQSTQFSSGHVSCCGGLLSLKVLRVPVTARVSLSGTSHIWAGSGFVWFFARTCCYGIPKHAATCMNYFLVAFAGRSEMSISTTSKTFRHALKAFRPANRLCDKLWKITVPCSRMYKQRTDTAEADSQQQLCNPRFHQAVKRPGFLAIFHGIPRLCKTFR